MSDTIQSVMTSIEELSIEALEEKLKHHLGEAAAIRKLLAIVKARNKPRKQDGGSRRKRREVTKVAEGEAASTEAKV